MCIQIERIISLFDRTFHVLYAYQIGLVSSNFLLIKEKEQTPEALQGPIGMTQCQF